MKEFDPEHAMSRTADLMERYNKLPKFTKRRFAFKALRELQGYETTIMALQVQEGQEILKDTLLKVFVETAAFFTLVSRDSDEVALALSSARINSAAESMKGAMK